LQGKRTPLPNDIDLLVLRCIEKFWQQEVDRRGSMQEAVAMLSGASPQSESALKPNFAEYDDLDTIGCVISQR